MENLVIMKRDDLEALALSIIEKTKAEPDAPMDAKEAAEFLGVSYAGILQMAKGKEIPCRSVWTSGTRQSFRFSRAAILEWLKA